MPSTLLGLGQARDDANVPACLAYATANLTEACVPSQKGLFFDWPQRHSVTRLRTSY